MTSLHPPPAAASTLAAAPAVHDIIAALPELIGHAMEVSLTPGLNVAVAHRGEVVYEDAFGVADLASGTPMATDTITQSGSITKLYTAVAVMQLAERGLVDVYAPVQRYLDVPLVNPLGERDITLYDLLTFRSGLATDTNYAQLYAPEPLGAFLEHELRAVSQPGYDHHLARWAAKVGERWEYSNLGLALAGRVVELVNPDGLSFGEYVEALILEPLGMGDSRAPAVQDAAHVPQAVLDRRSTGYALFGRTHVPAPLVHSPLTPAVGLLTTPGDHVKFLMALLEGGRGILRPETVRFMLAPHVTVGTAELDCNHNGVTFELGRWGTRQAHFGRTGVHTFGWLNLGRGYPHLDLAICVFTNRWDIRRWYNPDATMAPGAIAGFVAARLAGDDGAAAPLPARAPRTRAWKTSYAIGMTVAERLAGLLELDAGTIPATVAWMAAGAREQAGAGEWDADGFARGVADMLAVPMAPATIRRTLESDRLAISPEDLKLVWLGFSGRAKVPLPVGHWADAAHTARPRS